MVARSVGMIKMISRLNQRHCESDESVPSCAERGLQFGCVLSFEEEASSFLLPKGPC